MSFIQEILSGDLGLVLRAFGILLLTFVATLIIKFIIKAIHRRLDEKYGGLIHESFDYSLYRPLMVLGWVVGISIVVVLLAGHFQLDISKFINKARNVSVILCLMWFSFSARKQFGHSYTKKSALSGEEVDKVRIDIVSKLSTVLIVILTGLFLLEAVGVTPATVIAFGGVGGLAVSFAAKDVLANFLSGIMIYINRPFNVGEWIYSPDKNIEGTVESIGYYITKLRSFEKRPIYVPNAIFANVVIVNASRMSNRRIKHTVGVRYDDFAAVNNIVNDITKMLKEHSGIDQNQTTLVNFNNYGQSSLDIMVYTFTKTRVWREWLGIQQDVLLQIGKIVQNHGAQIAFPTRTLDMPKGVEPTKAFQ